MIIYESIFQNMLVKEHSARYIRDLLNNQTLLQTNQIYPVYYVCMMSSSTINVLFLARFLHVIYQMIEEELLYLLQALCHTAVPLKMEKIGKIRKIMTTGSMFSGPEVRWKSHRKFLFRACICILTYKTIAKKHSWGRVTSPDSVLLLNASVNVVGDIKR